MKGIVLSALMIAGVLLLAGTAIGLSYTKYDEATTTVTLDDGIRCCINGKEVGNGDTVTVKLEAAKLKVCVCSDSEQAIGYHGRWSSADHEVTGNQKDASTVGKGEFVIDFNHGSYTGILTIKYLGADSGGQTILFDFDICDGVTVTSGGSDIKNGDTRGFTDDTIYITVTTDDGQKRNISYTYWWGDAGEGGFGTGSEYDSTVQIAIENTAYFDPETGGVTIRLS